MKPQPETINASDTPINVSPETVPAPTTTQCLEPMKPGVVATIQPTQSASAAIDPRRRADLRLRRDSFLASLTSEQLKTLWQWFREHPLTVVRRMIALPPPGGFGMAVHDTTLRRAKATLCSWREIEDFRETCALSEEYSSALEEDQPNLSGVLAQILLKRALNIARNEKAGYDINELVANVVKLREIELKAERLRLDRQVQTTRPGSSGEPQVHEVNLNIRPPAPRATAALAE